MAQKTKRITPKQYADYRGWHVTNVTKHLRKGNPLDQVIRVINYSRFYLLEVSESLNAQSFETPLEILI